VNARSAVESVRTSDAGFDFEATFQAHYGRVARVIQGVVRDHARAEELAVEVFVKLWRSPKAHGDNVNGWLYRTAIHRALDELRRRERRGRYEPLFGFLKPVPTPPVPTPEELRATWEEQDRVRRVLASIEPRAAELLLLRGQGLSYEEVASALDLNPASVGTLLSRAQEAFRKEFVKRYGQQ
jgi:RNA polymerase sigma-70 factor (ECF subfamily)